MAAIVPVLVSGYHCTCQRCAHEWTSPCDCRAIYDPSAAAKYPIHKPDCRPPIRCPKCKAPGWERPAAWSRTATKPKAGRPPGRAAKKG